MKAFNNPELMTMVLMAVLMIGCSKPPKQGTGSQTDSQMNGLQENSSNSKNNQQASRRKAEVGVGKKGRKLDKHEGLISTPVKTYFNLKEQLAFSGAERALQMYEIQFGFPKTHEDYMREIIKKNNIQLPALPEGQYYEYDPNTHQLMVLSPSGDGN